MKLKSIRFRDVLSHVDSKIDVADHLTVITGLSDSGKSGAMRGLNQLFRNQPAGIDLLRHGAKRGACSEVEALVTHDGNEHTIVRRRGKSKNEYELDGQSLLAIGREVPEEATNITRLSAHAFQLQSDGNFLLSETDGEVAKVLSGTVGLAQIDKAFSEVRARKTENDTAIRIAQIDLDRESVALAQYADLDVAHEAVILADLAHSDWDTCTSNINLLDACADAISSLPQDAKPEIAVELLNDAILAANAYNGALCDLDAAERALVKLDGLAKDIGIMPRRATLLLTQATQKRGEQTMAEVDANDMVTLLARIDGCSLADATLFVKEAETALGVAAKADSHATQLEHEHEEVYGLFCELGKNDLDGQGCAAKVTQIRDMIEQYKREHSTCPECGAEQQHWHIV